MTVYEATKLKDFTKIVRFINTQPREFLPVICWQRGLKGEGLRAEYLKFWKTQLPYLHIFYVEDAKRKIRCVFAIQERMTVQKIPIATNASVVVEIEDWNSNNSEYFKEAVDHIIRVEAPKYKVERGKFFGVEKFAVWTQELCGEAMTITEKLNTDLGIVYRYEVNVEKYIKGLK